MRQIFGNTPILPDAEMRALGFTDHVPERWYWVTRVCSGTTLSFAIDKATGNFSEDVLDEYFGQPEYYMQMVPKYRAQTIAGIDKAIETLNAAGLTLGINHNAYGGNE